MTSVARAVRFALAQSDPRQKVMLTRKVARDYRLGRLEHRFDVPMPDQPGRPALPELLPPGRMPKRGKAGNARSRIALLHALAHIEFVAIDLALDMAGRFGAQFPRAFVQDWLSVAADEAIHFALLSRRLLKLDSFYGALPAHGGLWDHAQLTAQDARARLAVVPMVMEARGLDVTPATIERFERAGDDRSAAILSRIYKDEIRHVRVGARWFESSCAEANLIPHVEWNALIERHCPGAVKPPFNDSAREAAGLSREYYAGVAPR